MVMLRRNRSGGFVKLPVLRGHHQRRGHRRNRAVLPSAYLDETDVGALLTEALAAQIEAILPDKSGLVGAETAGQMSVWSICWLFRISHLASRSTYH